MIEEVDIRNFQAHGATHIEFDPKITTIVGASDLGKSAIFRALGWVALNNVPGDAHIKNGKKQAIVTLKANGHTIVRERQRGGASNTYTVDDKELKAFGTDTPPDVTKATRLAPINFQFQHDGPFWFGVSAGEVARQINAIVDLSIIDHTLMEVGQTVRKRKSTLEVCEDRFKQAKTKRDSLLWVTDVDGALVLIEEVEAKAEIKRDTATRLRSALENRAWRSKKIRGIQAELDALRALAESAQVARASMVLAIRLEEAFDNLLDRRRSIIALEKIVAPLPTLTKLIALRGTLELSRHAPARLSYMLGQLRQRWQSKKDAKIALDTETKSFNEKIGGLCPVCGGKYHGPSH